MNLAAIRMFQRGAESISRSARESIEERKKQADEARAKSYAKWKMETEHGYRKDEIDYQTEARGGLLDKEHEYRVEEHKTEQSDYIKRIEKQNELDIDKYNKTLGVVKGDKQKEADLSNLWDGYTKAQDGINDLVKSLSSAENEQDKAAITHRIDTLKARSKSFMDQISSYGKAPATKGQTSFKTIAEKYNVPEEDVATIANATYDNPTIKKIAAEFDKPEAQGEIGVIKETKPEVYKKIKKEARKTGVPKTGGGIDPSQLKQGDDGKPIDLLEEIKSGANYITQPFFDAGRELLDINKRLTDRANR